MVGIRWDILLLHACSDEMEKLYQVGMAAGTTPDVDVGVNGQLYRLLQREASACKERILSSVAHPAEDLP